VVLLLFILGVLTLSGKPCCSIEVHVANPSSEPLADALVRRGTIESQRRYRIGPRRVGISGAHVAAGKSGAAACFEKLRRLGNQTFSHRIEDYLSETVQI
jgi:hypothetical protein